MVLSGTRNVGGAPSEKSRPEVNLDLLRVRKGFMTAAGRLRPAQVVHSKPVRDVAGAKRRTVEFRLSS